MTERCHLIATRLLPAMLVAAAALIACLPAGDAAAELTTIFELDGNAITSPHPGPPDDWDRVYAGTGSAGLAVFQTDPQGVSLFKSGTKDIYDISTWQWNDQNAPPKDDITNAYAAVYGSKLFFGADRYSTGGTAYLGFWLLKGTAVFNADGTVTGSHQIGDILILANFINGGGTVVPRVFEWVGSGGSDGSLNERSADINTAYAIVNSGAATSPWPYVGKTGSGTFPAGAFFEGGADLGALGITGCFTDFICETRSSAEVGAELKDFVHHTFPSSPTVSVSDAAFCDGGSARLCAVVTGGVPPFSFAWSPTGSIDSCITATSAGWHRVTVTGANGCSGIDSAYVTVYPLPAFDVTGTNAICAGATTEFCGPDVTGYSYSWSGPGGFSKTTRCTGLISTAGTYTLTVTDAHGCQNSHDRTLTVYANPNCAITGTNAICEGATTEFCGPDVAGYSYAWTGPSSFTKSTRCTGTISTAGTYTLTITDAHGCQSTCSRTLTVYANPVCGITHTGGEKDTICPCFNETDPTANNEYCGPSGLASYAWSIFGGANIVGGTTGQCVIVRPQAHCDTTFTLYLTIGDAHGCTSSCSKTIYVVDKTPPVIVYCPPDTVLECSDNLDEAFNPLGTTVAGSGGPARAPMKSSLWQPVSVDNCSGDPSADYADTGGRPTNWAPRVEESLGGDSWGSCGQDTTVLRTWTVTDDCGNKAVCQQAIAIQDTVAPVLTCAVSDTVPCGTPVLFTPPSVTDNCDPLTVLEVTEVSTEVTLGPEPGDSTFTRCWVGADSCGNASTLCCQSIIVKECPEKFCTFTQGAWGNDCPAEDPLSDQAGCLLDRYFSQAFPRGWVGVGDTAGVDAGLPKLYAAVWTSADAVQAFLPAGGTSGMLTADALNPAATSAGVLAGQILALRLNVEFSCAGLFRDAGLAPGINCYRAYTIPASCGKFAGMTVEQFLAIADQAVGGKKSALNPYGATYADLNVTASCLNMLFDNCLQPVAASQAASTAGDARQAVAPEMSDESPAALVPSRFFVRQSYPNPFNPSATIVYGLPRDGRVTVEICDVAGRNVVTLKDTFEQAGYHTAVWFGRDGGGEPVASGVYFCMVRFGDQAGVQKLILLR